MSYAPAPGSLRDVMRRFALARTWGAAHPNGHKVGHFGDFRLGTCCHSAGRPLSGLSPPRQLREKIREVRALTKMLRDR
jgi:hypothetical protein